MLCGFFQPVSLALEKDVPETAKDKGCKRSAYCQQRQYRCGFRLPRFARRFDDYAVLFDWHDIPLDFRRSASPVKNRRFLDIVGISPSRRIFGSVP